MWSLNFFFSAIAAITAIVAIIWKPGLIYRNNHPPFLLNCYLYARTHSPKLRLLLVDIPLTIPMGTNSAPLLADLFLTAPSITTWCLQPWFETSMSKQTKAIQFSNTFRHIDGLYYSTLPIRICLEITSGPFTRRNWNTVGTYGQFHIINWKCTCAILMQDSSLVTITHLSMSWHLRSGREMICIPNEIFLTMDNAICIPANSACILWVDVICASMCAFGACTFIMRACFIVYFLV